MKLDSRILKGKKPLTCFDVEEAKKYIGKDCYFASKFERFENLSKVPHATLHNVDDSPVPFQCYGEDGVLCYDCFILPCEWVKPEEPEKKYRPFSLDEFLKIFNTGDLVEFRYKDSDEVKCAMFTGYITDVDRIDDKTPGAVELMLGIFHYSLCSLFEVCELFLNGEWQPFGVIDEQGVRE